MANKRLFLVHPPSGKAIYLGKRMGMGYYNVPSNLADVMQRFFDAVEWNDDAAPSNGNVLDDFVVDANDGSGAEYDIVK